MPHKLHALGDALWGWRPIGGHMSPYLGPLQMYHYTLPEALGLSKGEVF